MVYCFNEFILDTQAHTLMRGDERCVLEPLAFDVLVHFCEYPQQSISTASLYERHWPNVVVTANSLTRVIAQIRKTLGDDHRAPRFIETVPKTGYRFIAEVTVEAPSAPHNRSKPLTLLLLVTILVLFIIAGWFWSPSGNHNEPFSLAVFPFESPTDITIAESFSQEVLEAFYAAPEIQLRSFFAARQALEDHGNPVDAAESIAASHYISGKIEPGENDTDLIFYTELVETDTARVLWSQRITQPYHLQARWPAQVKTAVVDTLFGMPVKHTGITNVYTPVPEAYRLYLQARYIWLQRGKQPMSDAIYLLREAVTLDPKFASAWDSLAAALLSWQSYEDVPDSVLQEAGAAARHAIALNPDVSFSYNVLYQDALNDHRYAAAFNYARKMKDNAPNNAMAVYWYVSSLRELGHMQDSFDFLYRAVELDPTLWITQADFAIAMYHTAERQLAYEKLTRLWNEGARAMWLWNALFQAKLHLEEKETIVNWIRQIVLSELQQQWINLVLRAYDGEQVPAKDIRTVLEHKQIDELDHRVILYDLAYMQQPDLVFEYIETLMDKGQFVATYVLATLPTDYLNDPRMIDYFKQSGFLAYWRNNQVTDICQHQNHRWQCQPFHRPLTQLDTALLTE